MNAKKFFPIALFIGCQAFVIQVIDQVLSGFCPPVGNVGFGWIAFQAWAMYFLAGCDIKGGIKTFGGYVVGVVASIAIMVMGGALGSLGFFAMPVTLLVLVPFIIYFELGPWVTAMIPAVFVGAGVFFGFMSYVPNATFATAATSELIYCALGLVFGYCTVAFRGWYEKNYVN